MSTTKKLAGIIACCILAATCAIGVLWSGGIAPMAQSSASENSLRPLGQSWGELVNPEWDEEDAPSAQEAGDVVTVTLVNDATDEEIKKIYLYEGQSLRVGDIPVSGGDYVAAVDGVWQNVMESGEVRVIYESIPSPVVTIDRTELKASDKYTISYKQDMSFANRAHELDSTFYEYASAGFAVPGDLGLAPEYSVKYTYATGEERDMTYAWHLYGGDSGFAGIYTDSEGVWVNGMGRVIFPQTIEIEMTGRVIYDEDLYRYMEENNYPISFDTEQNVWISDVLGYSEWLVYGSTDEYNNMTGDTTQVSISPLSGAHLSVFKIDDIVYKDEIVTGDFGGAPEPEAVHKDCYYYLDRIPWSVIVTNDGDEPVTDIVVKDDAINAIWVLSDAENIGELTSNKVLYPGESAIFFGSYYVKKGDVERGYLTNTAYVSNAKSETTNEKLTDKMDDSRTVTVLPDYDHLDVVKEIVDQKDKYRAGDTITYKITVSNNTDYTVNHVQITDYFEPYELISGTIDGTPFEWSPFDPTYYYPGSDSSKENAGEVAVLSSGNELVNDTIFSVYAGNMEPGDTHVVTASHVITHDDLFSINLYNSARATGIIYGYEFGNSTDSYIIEGWDDVTLPLEPTPAAISVTKTLNNTGEIKHGDTVTFTITATNEGDIPLYSVNVVDDDVIFEHDCDEQDCDHVTDDGIVFSKKKLEPGESITFDRTYSTSEIDAGHVFSGTVKAFAVTEEPSLPKTVDYRDYLDYADLLWPNFSFAVQDSDEWSVKVNDPETGLKATVSPISKLPEPGEETEFEVEIENTSNITIENVKITDADGTETEVGTLAPNEKKTVTIKKTIPTDGEFSSELTVTGKTPASMRTGGGQEVKTETDLSDALVADGGILVLKIQLPKDIAGDNEFDVIGEDGNKVATVLVSEGSDSNSVELPFGKYTVKHVKVPTGAVKTGDIQFELMLDENNKAKKPIVEKTVDLAAQQCEIRAKSAHNGTDLTDGKFTFKDSDGKVIADDTARVSNIVPGIYTVEVKEAPAGYKLPKDAETAKQVEVSFDDSGNPVVSSVVTFDFVPFNIKTGVLIIESSTGDEADDTNVMKGSKYDLFAEEDIVDEDGDIVYKKGDKIAEIVGENLPNIKVELPIGTYRIVEITPPDGCKASDEPEKVFEIGEAELIITYVNIPDNDTPEAAFPSDSPLIESGNESILQTGDVVASVVSVIIGAVLLVLGYRSLRKRSE